MPETFESGLLNENLGVYYRRLFPFEQYYRWLSYGSVAPNYFAHREFSFTLEDDIYLRYQSFKDKEEMEKEIRKKCPQKIDIGAVFSFRPKDHRTVSVFTPLEKELVFDIDMTDYDEVRYCCSGAEICDKCWRFMTIAVKILDRALREDFGYKHILWVYSGRRGVHCWVCDAKARALSQTARTAVAEYLQVIRGGENQVKKVSIKANQLHPLLRKSEEIAMKHFEELCVQDQDMFGTPERWSKILALIPEDNLRNSLETMFRKCSSSVQRWQSMQKELQNIKFGKGDLKKGLRPHLLSEIVLQLVYPRLDINVSKQLNHLLKSPFCIHPKTGRVCVPFSHDKVEGFDPLQVPIVNVLVDEINAFDAGKSDEEKRIPDYKKTSLKESVLVFEKFLNGLNKENASQRLEINDSKMEF